MLLLATSEIFLETELRSIVTPFAFYTKFAKSVYVNWLSKSLSRYEKIFTIISLSNFSPSSSRENAKSENYTFDLPLKSKNLKILLT